MFEIKLIFYDLSRMLQFSQFVWPLSYSVWDVVNNFLLTDATDRSKISSDQKRFFITLSLYPLLFFSNTPFKGFDYKNSCMFLCSRNAPVTFPKNDQSKIIRFTNYKHWYLIHTSSWITKRLKRYRCKSDIAIFAWKRGSLEIMLTVSLIENLKPQDIPFSLKPWNSVINLEFKSQEEN